MVEDDPDIAELLEAILTREGLVDLAANGQEALELLERNYYRLIFSDLEMPIMNGLEFYRQAARKYPDIGRRMVIYSGALDDQALTFIEKAQP